jgi:hypothetical protein
VSAIAWLPLALAALCAGVMGYAVQRGATCMVAAIEEIVARRRATRVLAMLEASAMVAGGLAIASLAGLLKMPPNEYLLTAWTVAGGVMLGLGAVIARSCVFGAIARLGSGEWAYLAVPPGFFLGCIAGRWLLGAMAPVAHPSLSSPLQNAPLLILPFGAFLLWRGWTLLRAGRSGMLAAHVWSPHVATSIIGLAFVVLLLAAGPWSYTEALAQAAAGESMMTGQRLALFACLFGGAVAGGWTAGRLRLVPPTTTSVLRCLSGGALMGAGSVLIPGSNDGLLLVGLPLLQIHAWTALASMAATIFLALSVQRRAAMASARKLA